MAMFMKNTTKDDTNKSRLQDSGNQAILTSKLSGSTQYEYEFLGCDAVSGADRWCESIKNSETRTEPFNIIIYYMKCNTNSKHLYFQNIPSNAGREIIEIYVENVTDDENMKLEIEFNDTGDQALLSFQQCESGRIFFNSEKS